MVSFEALPSLACRDAGMLLFENPVLALAFPEGFPGCLCPQCKLSGLGLRLSVAGTGTVRDAEIPCILPVVQDVSNTCACNLGLMATGAATGVQYMLCSILTALGLGTHLTEGLASPAAPF